MKHWVKDEGNGYDYWQLWEDGLPIASRWCEEGQFYAERGSEPARRFATEQQAISWAEGYNLPECPFPSIVITTELKDADSSEGKGETLGPVSSGVQFDDLDFEDLPL